MVELFVKKFEKLVKNFLHQSHKMAKNNQKICRQIANELFWDVIDHFVGSVIKGLKVKNDCGPPAFIPVFYTVTTS